MPKIMDLEDPRYLDEVGWFLYHAKHRRDQFGGSYEAERQAYSELLLKEVLATCGKSKEWLADSTLISIGAGCTADLVAWPAGTKIAVDPLLYTYQHLGMLIPDLPETGKTVYLSTSGEDIPMLDQTADLILCRNALDHMPSPREVVREIALLLNINGYLYLDVDIGGRPTPDEPTVFSRDSLERLLKEYLDIKEVSEGRPNSRGRKMSVRVLCQKSTDPGTEIKLDFDSVLERYMQRNDF